MEGGSYSGFKLISAVPQEKDGQPGYEVCYPDGYKSWSPKDVFDAAYKKTDKLSFGHAFELMEQGFRLKCPVMKDGYFKVGRDPKDKMYCLIFTPEGENTNNHSPAYLVPTPSLIESKEWSLVD
jgi:hypothetical protein